MRIVLGEPGSGDLPEVLTSFVGRRNEAAQVKARMSESRLVTLVGAPGVGKTRLALHVAHSSRRAFSGGVWMVDLASLDDPDKVPDTFLAALDIREQSTRSAQEKLVDHLRERLALVLLDNCEHVVKEVAALTARLLRSCPRLHVLATSREPWTSTANTCTRCRRSFPQIPRPCRPSRRCAGTSPCNCWSIGLRRYVQISL